MVVKIMNLRNTKPSKPYDVRIDRQSVLGNPFYMKAESRRDYVCDLYQQRFDKEMLNPNSLIRRTVYRLLAQYRKDKVLRLFGWCAPKRCHAETIKTWLEENV